MSRKVAYYASVQSFWSRLGGFYDPWRKTYFVSIIDLSLLRQKLNANNSDIVFHVIAMEDFQMICF